MSLGSQDGRPHWRTSGGTQNGSPLGMETRLVRPHLIPRLFMSFTTLSLLCPRVCTFPSFNLIAPDHRFTCRSSFHLCAHNVVPVLRFATAKIYGLRFTVLGGCNPRLLALAARYLFNISFLNPTYPLNSDQWLDKIASSSASPTYTHVNAARFRQENQTTITVFWTRLAD